MADILEVRVPDIGDFDEVDVVEILVAPGDTVAVDDSLISLESDKASMEVPSPAAGVVQELKVSVGDQVGQDAVIALLNVSGSGGGDAEAAAETAGDAPAAPVAAQPPESAPAPEPPRAPATAPDPATEVDEDAFSKAYASPSVRKLARELGVDLGAVAGTGRKGRITPDDLKGWVKGRLASGGGTGATTGGGGISGFEWPAMPDVDFAKFGEVEEKPLARIRRVAARNLHRSWLHVPHVTQHEDADITEMEAFRKANADEAKRRGVKLTPLAFLLKACAATLREFPDFNASLHPDGDRLILKKYFHIGVAVDTPNGLVVPVIRDVDQKGLFQLADEVVAASVKAREGKLLPQDFQGACFTISSLGGIGGTAFTPIVNAPEVAILGVSRSKMQPVWNGEDFEPRLMLPLSLSYDHRVIDGASACRFTVHLAGVLADLRRLLL
ncbi:MAG: dihydrolipoyllysine-residue acetyltransferase [Acidobacteriota bacterium]